MTRLARPLPALAALALAGLLSAGAAFAGERPTLRGDVVAQRDSLTLGDLIEGAPAALAETALFRSPALGQTGTVQTRRIIEAAESLGLGPIETGGRLQIAVSRAARQVGAGEIEAALKRALQDKHGLEPQSTGITFDGAPPSLTLAPDLKGDVAASDLVYDTRNRRLSATIWVGPSARERRASLRVTGSAVEMVEVAILTRSLERGENVKATDLSLERRARDVVTADATLDGTPLVGRVAKRALTSGSLVRTGDLARPELVARGEIVTAVYESPGMVLSMRAKASEAGALGDVISVVNPGSKKVLQANVIGPGKVSVRAGGTERVVASNSQPNRP